mmetsp:Transcript_14522/g.47720  ORF Transcript_14522/g.47720 Transcript_14522/m.47720 type:complete len:84 (+) Transcript_14522:986-1237(+)
MTILEITQQKGDFSVQDQWIMEMVLLLDGLDMLSLKIKMGKNFLFVVCQHSLKHFQLFFLTKMELYVLTFHSVVLNQNIQLSK